MTTVEIRRLGKVYPDGHRAVDGIDLDIADLGMTCEQVVDQQPVRGAAHAVTQEQHPPQPRP